MQEQLALLEAGIELGEFVKQTIIISNILVIILLIINFYYLM